VDGWETTRFERDVVRLTACVIGAASIVGAALGWVGHQVFTHLHHESRSDHFRGSK
jgi:hypothetical protein